MRIFLGGYPKWSKNWIDSRKIELCVGVPERPRPFTPLKCSRRDSNISCRMSVFFLSCPGDADAAPRQVWGGPPLPVLQSVVLRREALLPAWSESRHILRMVRWELLAATPTSWFEPLQSNSEEHFTRNLCYFFSFFLLLLFVLLRTVLWRDMIFILYVFKHANAIKPGVYNN